jgi:NTE family protein
MTDDEGADSDAIDQVEFAAAAPAQFIEIDDRPAPTQAGVALCLSGGGYRAALFHLGSVWALKRAGVLPTLDRIASASGGSILAGLLAVKWREVAAEPTDQDQIFRREVVDPLFSLTDSTLDISTSVMRLIRLHTLFDPLVYALDRHLYNRATLQQLPDRPRFVINATNVQSGALWRFMKPRMRDWRVGDVPNPNVRISHAVAASAAFPPFLSPFILKTDPRSFLSDSGKDLAIDKFRKRIVLTDAGVYDNLAIETAWKKYDTLLISDAGWPLPAEHTPSMLWLGHTRRVVNVLTHQIALIRQNQVKSSFKIQRKHGDPNGSVHPLGRKGAYWGITSRPESYTDQDYYVENHVELEKVKRYKTRLERVPKVVREYLVDWGYFLTKLAIRKYMNVMLTASPPYSRVGK